MQRPVSASTSFAGSWRDRLITIIAIGLIVMLRIAWLDSDAYPRLSWSSALLTDEGFYIHNARNLVLFGHERLDGFNNMLIMPLLHLVQVMVFRLFGVGVVQARMISVVCSLVTLLFFWDTLRSIWGKTVAGVGVVFLGLDHVNLLYNRLGLMDTPCVLFMVAAWWAYIRAARLRTSDSFAFSNLSHQVVMWWGLSGVLLGLSYTVRGLAALIWWVPVWTGLKFSLPGKRWIPHLSLRTTWWYLFGLALVMVVYIAIWWWPNRVEIGAVSRYYIGHQLVPHSMARILDNLHKSMDWDRGFFPYLLKHTPVQFSLAMFALIARCTWWRHGRQHQAKMDDQLRTKACAEDYCFAWFAVFGLFCCLVNYSPSRYYVLFYPAMAGISAFTLNRISGWIKGGKTVVASAIALWAIFNCAWMYDWLAHLTYRQVHADHWLATHLPPDSVVLGAVAPGLCMNNRLRAVSVIEDLCNDDRPVERIGSAPGYILIIDDSWREAWWDRHYSALLTPDRRLHTFARLLRPFFFVGLYPANERAVAGFKEIKSVTGQNGR